METVEDCFDPLEYLSVKEAPRDKKECKEFRGTMEKEKECVRSAKAPSVRMLYERQADENVMGISLVDASGEPTILLLRE
ncbi:hypothetical protein RUM44_010147 [Polyplax serrata]|uniref:Uncharacterized protein n=1 Tax=Polyplax serrata TaxID=468196 RepID=A0ABR1AW76_POLSC